MSDYIMIDSHFNRTWVGSNHLYLDNTSERTKGDFTYRGWIKVKLLHGRTPGLWREYDAGADLRLQERAARAKALLSIIVPDFIILEGEANDAWIQPLHFLPNNLWKTREDVLAALWIDISCGETVMVGFKSSDFVRRFDDGSELYRCEMFGPGNLADFVTGPVRWDGDSPQLLLFHHTSESAREAIIESGHFLPSSWNIQGNKRLEDHAFVYLTPIPRLDCEGCLQAVAMASAGVIRLRRDPVPVPEAWISDDPTPFESEVLELEVYRETT